MISSATMCEEERSNWEEKIGFFSLWSAYELASDEYEQISSDEEYLSFKQNYQDLFVFAESEDDMAFFFKVDKISITSCLNMYGQAIIGGELRDFKNVNSISYWNESGSLLKGSTVNTPVGQICKKFDGSRYMRCSRERIDYSNSNQGFRHVVGYMIYMSAQKKGWFGWNDYTTMHYIKPNNTVQFHTWNTTDRRPDSPINDVYHSSKIYSDQARSVRVFYFDYGTRASSFKVWTRGVGEDDACYL